MIQRIKEVMGSLSGAFASPVAERRRERELKDEEVNAYEGMLELGDGSDDEGLPTDADSDADDQPAVADAPSPGAVAPTTGVDTRGFGWETLEAQQDPSE